MTLKKMDLDKDGKVSFSDFEATVKVLKCPFITLFFENFVIVKV